MVYKNTLIDAINLNSRIQNKALQISVVVLIPNLALMLAMAESAVG